MLDFFTDNILSILSIIIAIVTLFYTILIQRNIREEAFLHNLSCTRNKFFNSIDNESNLGSLSIELRNMRTYKNLSKLFLNKRNIYFELTKISCVLLRVDEFGIWVDLDLQNQATVRLKNNKEYNLSAYIPFEWIKVIDNLDHSRINSEFTNKNCTLILYIKASRGKFPYKLQNLISESLECIEVPPADPISDEDLKKQYFSDNFRKIRFKSIINRFKSYHIF